MVKQEGKDLHIPVFWSTTLNDASTMLHISHGTHARSSRLHCQSTAQHVTVSTNGILNYMCDSVQIKLPNKISVAWKIYTQM